MTSILRWAFLGFALYLLPALSMAQLVVAPINGTTITAATLANSLLGATSGITITGATYTGADIATGNFSGGAGIIGMASGVLLTSGSVDNVVGPNNDTGATRNNGQSGDADLTALAGNATHDGSVLTITFVPTGSTIQFSYIFGSEEYNEYVDSNFNDVFGFFVNGVNRALIPGTSTPVAINNVNCGYSSSGAPPGPGTHCDLFVNNDPPTHDTQLDGYTATLSFTAPVNPNVPNTLKIAIADTSDFILDSAVFIAGGSLSVVAPPTIAKSFGAGGIALSGSTALSFTITNPNASTALSGVGFADTLPAGLVVSTPNGLTGSCGGGTITATAGSGAVSLTGATLAANASCTFSVNVTGTTSGTKNNTTGAVTSVEGGTGGTASASVTVAAAVVVAPPTIAKSFGAGGIALGGSTALGFTIANPNASTALSGVGFADTLPAGLVVSTPNGLTGSCGGGTITATAGSGAVSLTGATLAANASCTFSVNVTGTTSGTKNNTTGAVTSVEGGTGGTASASVTVAAAVVVAPPTIAKSFGAGGIALGGSTALGFTIANPNASTALSGVGFADTLPAGLVVSTPNGLTGSCGGGTITATAGSGAVSLTGATLAANASCTFSVNVTGTTSGTKNNTTGAVTSVEGGTGGTAAASVTVTEAVAPPQRIPTLQQWALWLLGLLILIVTANTMSRPRKTH
jgi:hypothetical protein